MQNNRIYHVFKADAYFHTLYMVENIIKYSKYKHSFIIVGVTNKTKKMFEDLFTKYSFNYYWYIYINEDEKSFVNKIITKIFRFTSYELDLLALLHDLCCERVILHGDYKPSFYLALNYLIKCKVNWVCWGYIYTLPDNKLLNKLKFYMFKRIYNAMTYIICTMQPDCEQLKILYKCNNTFYSPYYSDLPNIADDFLKMRFPCKNEVKILLGNSGRCIKSYYKILDYLSRYKDHNIIINCMLNYGSDEYENNEFISYGKSIFGSKFIAHESLLALNEYYEFMNNNDVYIIPIEKQSGLGSIYLMLLLGKKIFLCGKNLEHVISFGGKVYSIEKINDMAYSDFIKNLDEEMKINNYRSTIQLLNIQRVTERWEFIYNNIINYRAKQSTKSN